jgi:hypothetical protein
MRETSEPALRDHHQSATPSDISESGWYWFAELQYEVPRECGGVLV